MAGPPPQAGIIEGANPVAYNPSSPITLFIIQASIVIIFCQLLHYPLRLIGQPRVIAEVIGGIILGPSVMMRIPNFQESIFPTESIPVFSNVANLGLIIFLFLVDIRLFTANWRVALSVGLAGMILPFGLGVAIAWGLYHQFRNDDGIVAINFGVYALFVGTALAITAFPVLCRILTELKLLRSNVGVTVLAAGIGNDVTGWVLLALCVALVNNDSGLAALWALLTGVAWTLFLVFAVRPVFMWILRRTGSIQNGPTQGMVALTMLLTLISSWFTGIIGIHPIFGAFLVGLICPHDGGFAIKLTEKIEDLITVLFLPLYFALSGLSTNLGLLNDGITWGYTIAVIVIAFSGKIIGGTIAAKSNGLLWRESTTIGVLMSCKGLVELIVLNIGLQAKILSARTFTMFVVMALVTTVATTPLTKLLYPPWYQQKVDRWRRGEIDWDGNPTGSSSDSASGSVEKLNATQVRRLLVYLRLDSLPSLFTFITLLGAETSHAAQEAAAASAAEDTTVHIRKRPLEVHGLRIIELTARTSSVMQVTEGEEYYSAHDPVVNAFRTFSQLNDVAAAGRVSVVPVDSYPETLMSQAADVSSDFALIPWSEYGSVTEDQSVPYATNDSERFKNGTHLEFIQKTLVKASVTCNAGIFINNGFGGVVKTNELRRTRSAMSIRSIRLEPTVLPITDKSHHVFFPFFGGVDDRVALRFVLQLAKNPVVTLTVAYFSFAGAGEDAGIDVPGEGPSTNANPKVATVSKALAVEDEVSAQDLALLHTLESSLPEELIGRVTFKESLVSPASALKMTVDVATSVVGQNPKNAGDIVVVGRRHKRLGDDIGEGSGGDFKRTVGVVADQIVSKGVKASLLVIQAGGRGLES
ncbi:putative K(+)/H(+) antiporter protein [Coniochaeta sp. 2T2.1]|nr:putative K(+)/H(+) antiporter protein [Coniochaeta sp. 2T2.1]